MKFIHEVYDILEQDYAQVCSFIVGRVAGLGESIAPRRRRAMESVNALAVAGVGIIRGRFGAVRRSVDASRSPVDASVPAAGRAAAPRAICQDSWRSVPDALHP